MAVLNRKNVDMEKKKDVEISLWENRLANAKVLWEAIEKGKDLIKNAFKGSNSQNGEGSWSYWGAPKNCRLSIVGAVAQDGHNHAFF